MINDSIWGQYRERFDRVNIRFRKQKNRPGRYRSRYWLSWPWIAIGLGTRRRDDANETIYLKLHRYPR